jgi:5-methylthioadenosine/S-adenosylhomocysteine deaminase
MLLIEGADLGGRATDLWIDGGTIARLEPHRSDAERAGSAGGGPGAGPPNRPDRVIDARGLHAFPALRNGHTHAAMTLFRGWGDDLPLMEWLRTHIWPAEERMTAEDVYHGTRLALVEMIHSGTTYFNDMYWHADEVARAVDELGLRAHIGSVFIDHGDETTARRWRDDVRKRVEERDALGPRMRVALAPHAIYTVSPDNLEWLGHLSREHDLLLHIHLSETREEVEECVRAHGVRPTRLLERVGLLSPNLIAAHGVYLDPEELAMLGEADATLVTNPTANLKLAIGGIFDYDAAKAAGVRVVLGTDGAGSNNNLDLIEEMKIATLVQKHRAGDPTSLPAHEALALATTAPSEAFRLGTGRLDPGELADLILVDLSHPSTQPAHDPVSDLVYAASGRAVHTTICDGRVLMHDRVLEVADEEEIVREAVRTARSLVERVEG